MPSTSVEALRSKLESEIDRVPWSELSSHASADRLFLVGASLDLLDVAIAIATDATVEVEAWIRDGLLTRPGFDDVSAWDASPQQGFQCVIVQPFVLALHPLRIGGSP